MLFKTPRLSIVDHPADDNHKGLLTSGSRLSRRRYQYIIIHATASSDSSGYNSLDYLSKTAGSGVSCHRYIPKDGTNFKLVDDTDVAWTQGPATINEFPGYHGNPNNSCLSIELENRNDGKDLYTNVQLYTCADQCLEWWGLYGLLPILGHWQVQIDKTDPAGFPWELFYTIMVGKLRGLLK